MYHDLITAPRQARATGRSLQVYRRPLPCPRVGSTLWKVLSSEHCPRQGLPNRVRRVTPGGHVVRLGRPLPGGNVSPVTSVPRPARLAASATLAALLAGTLVTATPVVSHAAPEPVVVADMRLDGGGAALVTDVEHTLVAPGLHHVRLRRRDPHGWLQVHVAQAELSDTTVRADHIGPERVAQGATVTEMAERTGAIAAVNGDFFDINNSWAPAGAAVSTQDGILKSPNPGRGQSVAFDESGLGRITRLLLEGSVELPDPTLPLAGVILYAMPAGGVPVYTRDWGEYARARAVPAGEDGIEVVLDADGRVTSVGEPAAGQLPDGVQALVARPGAAATALGALEPGAEDAVGSAPAPDDVRGAIGRGRKSVVG